LSLGGCGWGVLIEKLLDVALVGFGVLGGQDCGAGSETMAQPLSDERCLPGSVRGPVERWELARFVAARPSSAALGRRALCAFEEFAGAFE
jgi:hypothetical protein